ncbi:hypothetical protein KKI19_00140 [Patescibacteria group bacterium]|nr:hypothetical protein [Patescibacteria group bacterium]
MNKNIILLFAVVLLIVAIASGVYLWWSMKSGAPSVEPTVEPTPIASPEVMPTPEETPIVEEIKSDLEQIKEAFAEKYNRSVEEVDASIDNNTGTYANGLVRFAGEIGGGWWLAYNNGDGWIIVADGNGSVLCDDIEGYDFPTDMVPECWDEATSTLIQR